MLQSRHETSRFACLPGRFIVPDDYTTLQQLTTKRDQKVTSHLEQYAPVWIVDEKPMLVDEAIQFTVLFLHPTASDTFTPAWVERRYRYDAFNDTLYHKGQTRLTEDAALDLIANKDPYISTTSEDMPNAYGG
jgi:hypothetical protein